MRSSVHFALAVTWLLLTSFACLADNDYLSIKFSEKHQVRTGLIWIQHRPTAVLGEENSRRAKRFKSTPDGPQVVAADVAQNQAPYSRVGKLLYTRPDGSIASCSAAFAGQKQVLLTAAHCVMSATGDWHGDFLFIRSFGGTQHDVYAIQCIGLPSAWGSIGSESLSFDYAFLQTTRVGLKGHLELAINPPPQTLKVIGYSDAYLDGQKMFEVDVPVSASGLALRAGDNPLGHGSSGAPWVQPVDSVLYSLTSHYEKGDALTAVGPRIDSESVGLMQYVERGCESPG